MIILNKTGNEREKEEKKDMKEERKERKYKKERKERNIIEVKWSKVEFFSVFKTKNLEII